jgi:TonB family protein
VNKRFVTAAENAVRSWTFETSDHEWKTGVSFEFRSAGKLESVTARSPNIKQPMALPESGSGGAGHPLQVGGAIKPPRILTRTKPQYTQEALKAKIEGTVVLQITIDRNGHVADAKVMRSIPLLDQAAIDTVKAWTFEPTLLNGAPVDVSMYVTLNFRLS